MIEKWKNTFLAHSKTSLFRKKIIEANNIIEEALLKFKKPIVAFSGGKDSTCVLDLVLKHSKDVLVYHFYFGKYYVPYELEQQIIQNAKKIGAKRILVKTSKQYEILKREAINVLMKYYKKIMEPYFITKGYDIVFLGLRKEESLKRKRKIENSFFVGEIKEIYPIQNWTWVDVWAYIVVNDLPYLEIYDKYAEILGYDNTRFTTFFDPEFSKLGASNVDGVVMWKFKNILY